MVPLWAPAEARVSPSKPNLPLTWELQAPTFAADVFFRHGAPALQLRFRAGCREATEMAERGDLLPRSGCNCEALAAGPGWHL